MPDVADADQQRQRRQRDAARRVRRIRGDPDRADFLGDVAKAAVDKATTGTLGKPAQIAKVLGAAAARRAPHPRLHPARGAALATQLGIAGQLDPVRSDAIAVTTSNLGGNKIDYYLDRALDYRVKLQPDDGATASDASGNLSLPLDNTAPAEGLPQIVIGPFIQDRFVAGENRTLLSMYSPLPSPRHRRRQPRLDRARARAGRNVYSLFEQSPRVRRSRRPTKLAGPVKLHQGWYTLRVHAQPTLNPDRVHVSVEVPEGWKIDRAPKMERLFSRRVSVNVLGDKSMTFRVHITPDAGSQNLWDRLVSGD